MKSVPKISSYSYQLLFYIIPIATNQLDELFHGLFFGDVLFDAFLFLIETHLATTGTYVSIIGIGHFAGTVHNAAHNAYLQAFEV